MIRIVYNDIIIEGNNLGVKLLKYIATGKTSVTMIEWNDQSLLLNHQCHYGLKLSLRG